MIHLFRCFLIAIVYMAAIPATAMAQSKLDRTISISATRMPVKQVLKDIGTKGGFHFSYNSNIIKEDSLVSLSIQDKSIRQTLDILFDGNIEYKEKDNHIILQRAPGVWYVSGYVTDELTGERIPNASVYERSQLVASLTNDQGYFQLKLKDRLQPATISVSKAWYADTSIPVRAGNNQEITVPISPKSFALDSIVISPNKGVEDTWLGKFLLSSGQKMQSLNISKFFVDMPYQASVIPGIGTHGKMGGQITNKVSFNLLGGYAAGVDGMEIGGLFNITKKDARYVQVAGLFNVTGRQFQGVQVAGLYNHALDTLDGVQIGGLSNVLLGSVDGIQVGGLYNHILYDLDGAQIAGLSNYLGRKMEGIQIAGLTNFTGHDFDGAQIAGLINVGGRNGDGVQIAGLGNFTRKEIDGIQIAGLFNVAKHLKGVQIGVINISDTSSGYSIGVLNLVRKGFHKLSFYTNEFTRFNASFKAGNKKLYSILHGGYNADGSDEVVTFGYGIGKEISLFKWLSLNPELTAQYIYLGRWNNNLLAKFHTDITIHLHKYISVFGGPSYAVYLADEVPEVREGFRKEIPGNGIKTNMIENNMFSWVGWHVGINIF